jgi:hypothetical protein
MDTYGFVVLRYVINEETNEYWNECVKRLNYFYPYRQIVIIDDNSKKEYVKELYKHRNISIYSSEYPQKGELIPFLYFLKYHWFQRMVFIHDSCFFHKRISFDKLLFPVMPLWHFNPDYEQTHNIQVQLNQLNHSRILHTFFEQKNTFLSKRKEWYGTFGLMCIIDYEFLNLLNEKYKLHNLTQVIKNRQHRCGLERTLSILFHKEFPLLKNCPSLLGCIFQYGIWNLKYETYKQNKYSLPIVKVWSGR